MEVRLTPDQEALIRQAVASGRYPSPEEAVKDALARWAEDERERAELIASFEEVEAEFEAGLGREYTKEQLPALFEELKAEARALRDTRRRG